MTERKLPKKPSRKTGFYTYLDPDTSNEVYEMACKKRISMSATILFLTKQGLISIRKKSEEKEK